MSLSGIISQDITQQIDLPTTTTSAREASVFKAYQNDPWLHGTAQNVIDQKMLEVDRDLLFQILMIENVSKSKQTQYDDLKAKIDPKNQKVDRLKDSNVKGPKRYQMVTQVNMEDDNLSQRNNNVLNDKSVFKLAIQSKAGDIFFAVNTTPLPWSSCMLGSKITIKPGTIFNRGMFILKESNVTFLGGINRTWNENKDYKMCDYFEAKLDQYKSTINNNTRKRRAPAT
ncbi:hypothetical protein KAFR_0H01580 [Kazachstania africana CBS 2517]|uniref:RecQ mediated genome instability protein 1 OB-fold domain-containing protein n=1 Tax=Kazachstania africana (strain ATCC 22294 / BCRC 22015 / CBS 2517 / CECT 1963 / NBRC 1671 / NRRL Y-8276) TaxID=1071382 RepID=H2AZ12_KAZAF|nr:hypothetical protein KAFR_0H01580 [Kazachstania africana CBS 2517]CCF59568.1 hypothetical protein KAFR_0H01580 [Kazachstania africana CBS 2517]